MTKAPTIQDLQKQITENLAATTRILQESAERDAERAKAQAARDKLADKRHAELEKTMAETSKEIKSLSRDVKKVTLEYGNRGNERGFVFERAVFNTLEKTRDLCGIRLDGGVRFNVYAGGFQYDMVALNGKKTIVVEAKITLSVEHVNLFANFRLPFFNGTLPEYTDGKKIIGAMVYQRTDEDGKAVDAALSRGLLVLCADSKKHLQQITSSSQIKERNNPPAKK